MKKSPSDIFMAFTGLFVSFGTLLCCALPALLIALGFGAVVAGVVSNFPGIMWLSRNKFYVFLAAGIFLILAGFARTRPKARTCPPDPLQAKICGYLKTVSTWTYWISVVLYITGVMVSFVLPLFI